MVEAHSWAYKGLNQWQLLLKQTTTRCDPRDSQVRALARIRGSIYKLIPNI